MNYRRLVAVSSGHMAIDILSSSVAMLLTTFAGLFELTTGQIAQGAMIYMLASSLTQPFFGLLADRLQGRWLGAISVGWLIFFFALVPWMTTYPMLILCLTLGGLGSGAFHAVGMVNASNAGGAYPATATSIFFLCGQTGLALGPMITGIILQRMGIDGFFYLTLAMTPAFILGVLYLRTRDDIQAISIPAQKTSESQVGTEVVAEVKQSSFWIIAAFIVVIALRSATLQSFTTLMPKYFDDLGYLPSFYGSVVGVFWLAAALGTFVGGPLGDRYNRRALICATMLLSIPACYAILTQSGDLFWIGLILAGASLNFPHSILLVMAQRIWPQRQGMISGTVLGFTFASGAVAAWIAGEVADNVGLYWVLLVLSILPVGAALFALWLPPTRTADSG